MFENLYERFEQLKTWTIEQIIWAEKNLKDKSGAEKKAAVIKKLDDLITLPFYLEWMDDKIIAWLVDAICEKLNGIIGHNFEEINELQEKEIIKDITLQEDEVKDND